MVACTSELDLPQQSDALEQGRAVKRQGKELLEAGDTIGAVACFKQALACDPNDAQTLLLLGLLSKVASRFAEAEQYFRLATAADPHLAEPHYLLGALARERGELDLAIAYFRHALECKPDFEKAQRDLVVVLHGQRRYTDAEQVLPLHLAAHIHRGTALMEQNKLDEALACYQNLLAINPEYYDAHFYLANVLSKQAKPDDAIEHYKLFLACKPHSAEGQYNLGTVLLKQDRFEEAIVNFRNALQLDPGLLKAHINLGMVLCKQKKFEEALACYRSALAIDREYADVHLNHGVLLQVQNKLDEAIAAYRHALTLDPVCIEAYLVLASALSEQHQFDEAWDCYEKALAIEPGSGDAHFGKALWFLLKGEFLSGWREYEYRWKCTKAKALPRMSPPVWLGDADLSGKSILLRAEQGYGDTIQFVRYAPQIAALGATVYLEVYPALKALLASVPGVAGVFVQGESVPHCDYQCPLMSLPLACKTEQSAIPAAIPYIGAPRGRVQHWASHLRSQAALRIGIAWAGNPAFPNDHNRSIPLSSMVSLCERTNRHFYSLQKDLRDGDAQLLETLAAVTDLAPHLLNFTETAAVIANLDLVITVDTAVAHLAGALGKPVWILLPFKPDWRWLLGRADSPWYPAARLFRQPAIGDWSSVIEQVRQALAALDSSLGMSKYLTQCRRLEEK